MDAHFDQTLVELVIFEDTVAVTDTIQVQSPKSSDNIHCSVGIEESDVNSPFQSVAGSQMEGIDIFFLENERLCDHFNLKINFIQLMP